MKCRSLFDSLDKVLLFLWSHKKCALSFYTDPLIGYMLRNKVIYEAVKTEHQATQHGAYDTPKVAFSEH